MNEIPNIQRLPLGRRLSGDLQQDIKGNPPEPTYADYFTAPVPRPRGAWRDHAKAFAADLRDLGALAGLGLIETVRRVYRRRPHWLP
jgi:hypothetical protein